MLQQQHKSDHGNPTSYTVRYPQSKWHKLIDTDEQNITGLPKEIFKC